MKKIEAGSFSLEDILVYGLIGPSLVIYHGFERAKFIYFIPILFAAFIVFYIILLKKKGGLSKLSMDSNVLIAAGLFVFISICSFLFSQKIYDYEVLIRDFLIILSPLVVFGFHQRFNMGHVYFLFLCSLLSYFLWIGLDIFKFQFSLNFLTSNYNTNAEFHNGIIFGGFSLIFLLRKKWMFFLLSLVVIIMTGKRSIMLGLLPALLVSPLFFWTNLAEKKGLLFAFLLGSYLIAFTMGIYILQVSDYVLEIFDPGGVITVDKFLMGREVFVEYVFKEFFSSPFQYQIFGNGGGQTDSFLRDIAKPDWVIIGKPVNPHNDYLKILFDYGLFGILGFFMIFYSFYVKTRTGILVFFYTLGVFFVDNSFIFIYYWFIVGVISRVDT